jgi:hypothetical protein
MFVAAVKLTEPVVIPPFPWPCDGPTNENKAAIKPHMTARNRENRKAMKERNEATPIRRADAQRALQSKNA